MKTTEFKKLVSEAKSAKWLNSVDIFLTSPILNLDLSFKGIAALHKFAEQQYIGWKSVENLPDELVRSRDFFPRITTQMESYLENNKDNEEESYLKTQLDNSVAQINHRIANVFTYDSPEANFLLNLYRTKRQYFPSAFAYLCGNLDHNINQQNNFIGYLMAYEFQTADSKISERAASEKISINRLKQNFQNSLPELDKQLVDHLKDSADKYDEYVTRIDDFQVDKEKTYSDWFINTKGGFESFDTESKSKINELEETYREKLKLEGPATYWSERGKKMMRQGWIALSVLIILVFGIVWSLGEILWSTPQQIYTSFFEGDKSAAIRWSIVYITFISFMVFCVKAISKVMFSSFHLARDCEERHTLTYFYLSLLKESSIESEEKKLIMQSLFSRADTGLLKEDSSPSMPNDLAGKFFSSGK